MKNETQRQEAINRLKEKYNPMSEKDKEFLLDSLLDQIQSTAQDIFFFTKKHRDLSETETEHNFYEERLTNAFEVMEELATEWKSGMR